MNRRRALGAGAGLVADVWIGEPPVSPHPVAAFGTLMGAVETHCYRDSRLAGMVHAALGVGIGWAAGTAVRSSALATYLVAAPRGLWEAAESVGDALVEADLGLARARLPALVGRDPTNLDDKEIARAVVESVAENTVDAVVAPALWAAVAGAPGALAYRAVNTLDAMVGHRNPRYRRFGWASARLDDMANLAPARLTALAVAAVRPGSANGVWRAVRSHAKAHPSPNSGVAEAAFAAALGLRLGGPSSYDGRVEDRPALGWGRPPEPDDIADAVRLSRDITLLLATALIAVGVVS